ncbi:MAG: hypothetical protein JO257_38560 [Deltaproteobacteria bacterium]|nr:hypothetical protein [Deltaproteobacteria bacterium]
MRVAALVLLGGCSAVFGLAAPQHAVDAADDSSAPGDSIDAKIDIADAAPGHCVTQADCPTSVCLPSTVCAADTDVAWLAQSGTPGSMCTMQTPCARLLDALQTNKPYIRVAGTISNLASIGHDVMIFAGESGAGFNGTVNANSGVIGLYGLNLTSGNNCVNNSGGTLTIEHAFVHACGSLAISSGSPLTLDGSTITRCRNGGVVIQGGSFVITNNFITQNGLGMTQTGGVTIQMVNALAMNRLDFNTIATNNIKSSPGVAGGVYCNLAGFTGVGNVIVHNTVNGSTSVNYANTNGQCSYTSSVIQAADSLGFVNTGAGNNYHLTAQSSLRDVPGVTTSLTTDVDGESRPYGNAYDLGADEYHP